MCHNECSIIAIQVVIYFLNYYNFSPKCRFFFFPLSRLSLTQGSIQLLWRKISLSLSFCSETLVSASVWSVAQSRPTCCRPHGLWSSRLLCPWDFSGKNAGAGCHFLPQGIFLTQGLNPWLLSLLQCRWIFYYQCHVGSHTISFFFIVFELSSVFYLFLLYF